MTRLTTSSVATLAMLAVALFAAVGGAAAHSTGDTHVHVANPTVAVDADTQSVYADVNASQADTTANVTVTFEAMENGSVTSTLATKTATVAPGSSQLIEQSVNGTEYDAVRISVVLDNSTASPENVSVSTGKIQMVAGGGGGTGLPGGSVKGVPVLLVVAVVGIGGYLWISED
ncbi:hypothetical protein [Halobaculum sp. D14]|uniref:hypothetical protein n=1 Tax=Halobaculum sp. D14 TaxID=3421642 RepID=UPI003EC012C1